MWAARTSGGAPPRWAASRPAAHRRCATMDAPSSRPRGSQLRPGAGPMTPRGSRTPPPASGSAPPGSQWARGDRDLRPWGGRH
eukprot:10251382-Alexandrium_andersonii.AAC.1